MPPPRSCFRQVGVIIFQAAVGTDVSKMTFEVGATRHVYAPVCTHDRGYMHMHAIHDLRVRYRYMHVGARTHGACIFVHMYVRA